MKILAIRGANLASLEGEFELPLAEGPLGDAGVFAICGPTGAGKSTLLDAMCLALFDTAPRLEGRGRGRVGHATEREQERLTVQDPRSLLRKGAAFGFAEVDFEGVDGRRYRSRWEVRRARNKASGKLQPTKMTLSDLDAEWTEGGRKSDVRDEIDRRLGLTFDQFRRSVLLAQGDFAAFLEADPRDRADLLERMTGTEIYGLISQEAHARANAERHALARIEERRLAIHVYAPEERAALEREVAALAAQVREDELAMHDAARALRWHAELEGLRREEAEARTHEAWLEAQLELAETQREKLAAVEAALPLRPRLEALDVASAGRALRQCAVELAWDAASSAAAQAQQATVDLGNAEHVLAASEASRERARPQLERARAMERELAALDARVATARARERAAEATLTERVAEHEALSATLAAEATRALEAQAWLDAHPEAALAEADWPRVSARLGDLLDHEARAEELARAIEPARRAVADAAREREAAAEAWQWARAQRAEAELRWRAADEAARAAPYTELVAVRDRWSRERTALETLIGVADGAQAALSAARREDARVDEHEASAVAAEREAQEAAPAAALLAGRIDEAQRARDALRARLDLTERRSELRANEPCPLCGSCEHPFAHESPVMSELAREADARLRALHDERAAVERRGAERARAASAHREAAARAREDAARWRSELVEARARYRRVASELAEGRPAAVWPRELPEAARAEGARGDRPAPALGDGAPFGPLFAPLFQVEALASEEASLLDDAAREALTDARAEADARLAELSAAIDRRRTAEEEATALRAALEVARDAESAAREALATAEAAARDAAEVLSPLTAALVVVAARIGQRREELAPVLTAWSAHERGGPAVEGPAAAWADAISGSVEARRARRATLDEAQARTREHAPAHAGLTSAVASAYAARELAQAERVELEAAHGALVRERAALFTTLEAGFAQLDDELRHDERRADARREARERAGPHEHGRDTQPDVVSEPSLWDADARCGTALRDRSVEARGVDSIEAALAAAVDRAKANVRQARAAATEAARDEATRAAERARADEALVEASALVEQARAALDAALARAGLDEATARAQLAHDPAEVEGWRRELERLDRARREQRAVVAERARKREVHEATDAPRLDAEAAQAQHGRTYERLEHTRELHHAARRQLERDDEHRAVAGAVEEDERAQRERLGVWETLAEVIGSASGAKLRVFAQSLTLELLLEHANHHLAELAPRFGLARVPGDDLALQVIDHEMADEVRSVSSLSGGESFLVALGLALGLASLTSQRSRVDSLFIDEGFGALDPASLELVLATLDTLQARGRQVGVISHVGAIAERFATRVDVTPTGPASSRVELVGTAWPRAAPEPPIAHPLELR